MRIVTYLRCSTPEQGEADRFGLDRQRQLLSTWLAENLDHHEIDEVRDIGHSGATADRPGLASIMVRSDFDALLVPCWDRLARDLTLMGYIRHVLKQKNAKVLSASENNAEDPTSIMVQGILAAVAGFERALIAQRLAGARRLKAARGGYANGQPCYGLRSNGRGELEIEPKEWEWLQSANKFRLGDTTIPGYSFQRIADLLTRHGAPTKHGGTWTAATVRSMLQNYDRVKAIADAGT